MKEKRKPTGMEPSSRRRTKARSGGERFNQPLLDAIPYPAMLVHRGQTILASNRMAREAGALGIKLSEAPK